MSKVRLKGAVVVKLDLSEARALLELLKNDPNGDWQRKQKLESIKEGLVATLAVGAL